MKAITIVCLTLIAGAFAAPAQDTKSLLTDAVRVILENVRGKLADLAIERIDVGEKVHLSDIVISNADTFVIEALKSPLNPLSLLITNATLSLEEVSAMAQYAIEGVELPDLDLVLNGAGAASALARGARIEIIEAQFQLNPIKLDNFQTVRLTVRSAEVQLEGVDQQVNDALSKAIPDFLNNDMPGIIADNKQAIIDMVNVILASIV